MSAAAKMQTTNVAEPTAAGTTQDNDGENEPFVDFQSPFRRRKVLSRAKHTISAG